jgi:plasmid stability protein
VADLIIPDVEEVVLQRLQEEARRHGRTAEAEARSILAGVLQPRRADVWDRVNALRRQLAASGRTFSDSTELLREDRDR